MLATSAWLLTFHTRRLPSAPPPLMIRAESCVHAKAATGPAFAQPPEPSVHCGAQSRVFMTKAARRELCVMQKHGSNLTVVRPMYDELLSACLRTEAADLAIAPPSDDQRAILCGQAGDFSSSFCQDGPHRCEPREHHTSACAREGSQHARTVQLEQSCTQSRVLEEGKGQLDSALLDRYNSGRSAKADLAEGDRGAFRAGKLQLQQLSTGASLPHAHATAAAGCKHFRIPLWEGYAMDGASMRGAESLGRQFPSLQACMGPHESGTMPPCH